MIEKSSNVPRIVDRLELKELIERTQGEFDGRQTVIILTEKGIDVLTKATEKLNQDRCETINKISCQILPKCLKKILVINLQI